VRICFVGDSFVNGTADPECLGWSGRICAAARRQGLDLTYYNLGIRGETSADIRARWLDEVSRRLPEEYDGRIVFSFGVNDTTFEDGKPRVEPDGSVEHARAILSLARASYPVLMVGPPPTANREQNDRIARLSDRFALLCRDLNLPYLSTFSALRRSGPWMREVAAGDGAHPSAGGYAEMARLVADWIEWRSWLG
jgi:lysophospholipase L1-like esterase